jgi:hypothetical protein
MLCSLQIKKILMLSALLLCVAPVFAQAEPIDNDANAILLLNRATGKHRHQSDRPWPDSHSAKLRSYRNSSVAAYNQEDGNGVSLGNIHPAPGTNRPHSTTVIVDGNIIISGNR